MDSSRRRELCPRTPLSLLGAGVLAVVAWSALAGLGAAPRPALASDDFFDQSVLHDLRLVMKASDWAALQAAYLNGTYYPADMHWRDQTVSIVGVRSRGSGRQRDDYAQQ